MGVFDENSNDFKQLDPRFRKMIKFGNDTKTKVEKNLNAADKMQEDPVELKQQLKAAREIVEKQFKLIEKFVSLPNHFAYFVKVNKKSEKEKPSAEILYNGRRQSGAAPENERKPGQRVRLSSKTLQIIDTAEPETTGPIATVSKILSSDQCEVIYRSDPIIVLLGLLDDNNRNAGLEAGDRVVLDGSASIILANL